MHLPVLKSETAPAVHVGAERYRLAVGVSAVAARASRIVPYHVFSPQPLCYVSQVPLKAWTRPRKRSSAMHGKFQAPAPRFELFGVDVEVETLIDGRPVIRADLVSELITAVAASRPPNLAELQRFSSWIRLSRH
ncbi:hypothetical protein VDR42_15660 [Xanthomonas campestris pv. campestris]|nr:hypothetical protein [Xanthomonas campestris pv. campestris]MEB1763469.1 hypothetical protein [Xanthomonas campestris pv. campestris]MEB1909956.1 hypothetical protein [Xanthomonas campestris pv. campestris]